MTISTPGRRGSRRRVAGLSAAVAGVAAAAVATVLLTGVTGSPAFAVTKGSDGAVSVRINEFSDPDGLAAELADAGVKAVVDYLPEGQTCKEPRGERGSLGGRFAVSVGKAGDGISFTIEKGQVPAGETLVLAVSLSRDGADRPPFATALHVVRGAVADCEPVAMPEPGSGTTGDGPGLDSKTGDGDGPSFDQKNE
ncbi:hypothetical protein [Nonomuraea zeae]|uniref:Uncharacterized protein n=1 Tax=Nonomuraea zeae TaxID=1642303 RepID=A0A5S4G3I7_9ACTN|nr:hypothetical protein [Nonomuraea zeae]TMR27412.1 hypothetical protein ETD85_39265 [Nonomuraea zeae]